MISNSFPTAKPSHLEHALGKASRDELDFIWLVAKAFVNEQVVVLGLLSEAAQTYLESLENVTFVALDGRLEHAGSVSSQLASARATNIAVWLGQNDGAKLTHEIESLLGVAQAVVIHFQGGILEANASWAATLAATFKHSGTLDLRRRAIDSKSVGNRVDSDLLSSSASNFAAYWVDGERAVSGLISALSYDRNEAAGASSSERAENEILRLRHEIDQLRGSTSWRLTHPVRRGLDIVRMGRKLAARLRRAVSDRGGYRPACRGAYLIYRSEGVTGLIKRVQRLRSPGAVAQDVEISYAEWIEKFDTIDEKVRARLAQENASLARTPLISILVPTFNTSPILLQKMFASVQRQIYQNWELCIADDASTDSATKEELARIAALDRRVKVELRDRNGHISAASNSALKLAQGEFIALLDHDDELAEHALLVVVRYINAYPHAKLFYSDEDKLDLNGERVTPYFKPDWNIHLIRSQNYFSHLGIYNAEIVSRVGGFRLGFEGSQDHDLMLRCADEAGDENIVHIPHVLYHWRMVESSTALDGGVKPYAQNAAMRAVQDHLTRRKIAGTVRESEAYGGYLRTLYDLPSVPPRVTIVIPTRDGVGLLRQCIESIFAHTNYSNFEIIIVDNGSVLPATLDYFSSVSKMENVSVLRYDAPFNYSALNNFAVAQANGEFICLMNNDIEAIRDDWLTEMVGIALQPAVGAVGARLWYPDDRLQHGGVVLGIGGVAGHMHHMLTKSEQGYFSRGVLAQDVSAVTAACLVIRKAVYDEVGGLDETLAVAFNDVDFCIRVRDAGYRNVWTPHAELYHYESATRGSDLTPAKRTRFESEVNFMLKRWGTSLQHDPAYNVNLSLVGSNRCFAIAAEPRRSPFTAELPHMAAGNTSFNK